MRTMQLRVRWGELDPYHHVNHAVYLTYLETARIAALDGIGWAMSGLAERGYMIVVAELRLKYRRPAAEGDLLTIETAVDEIRAASTVWRQRIRRDGELILSAEVVGAVTDLAGRPRRLPPELRAALAGV
jgi:acyl-CoA thioester hydrolase